MPGAYINMATPDFGNPDKNFQASMDQSQKMMRLYGVLHSTHEILQLSGHHSRDEAMMRVRQLGTFIMEEISAILYEETLRDVQSPLKSDLIHTTVHSHTTHQTTKTNGNYQDPTPHYLLPKSENVYYDNHYKNDSIAHSHPMFQRDSGVHSSRQTFYGVSHLQNNYIPTKVNEMYTPQMNQPQSNGNSSMNTLFKDFPADYSQKPMMEPMPQQTRTRSPDSQHSDDSPKPDSPTGKRSLDPEYYSKVMSRKRRYRKAKVVNNNTKGIRACEWCQSSSTPEWRKGPNKEVLCNACGLQWRKHTKDAKVPLPPGALGLGLDDSGSSSSDSSSL